jgi:hypothetical protein
VEAERDPAYLAADADDRRTALSAAIAHIGRGGGMWGQEQWPFVAEDMYRWLRKRESLRAVAIEIIPGKITKENTVATSINLEDDDQQVFTLTGTDSKGVAVPAPSDTWNWTLNDPDASGASLSVSDDTTSATVAAGVPTVNLSLSVVGANTGLSGAEAILVTAGPAVAVGIVPGAVSPEGGSSSAGTSSSSAGTSSSSAGTSSA